MGVNKNPLISVIITTYNRENLVLRALKSVLNQTFKYFEVLLVDDGSTDNTHQAIKEIQKEDKRVVYIYQENKGWPSALNTGLSNTQGRYIAFLDSDDEWLPEKLEKQISFLENNKSFDGVTCYGNIILDDKEKIKLGVLKQSDDYNNQLKKLINGDFRSIPSSLLLKKEIFEKVGYYDEFLKLSTDADMMIRIFKAGFKIGVIKEVLFNYYIHKQNLTEITAEAKIKSINQRINETVYILNKHKEIYDQYSKAKSLMLRYLSTFYKLINDEQKSFYYAKEAFKTNKRLRNIFHFILLLLPYKFFLKLYDFKVNLPIYKAILKNKFKI
jgi:glycosyltransferase involved in cell wall biosynthesis